ncbi:MAG: ribonuclease P protein component [Myxococcota bacterium]
MNASAAPRAQRFRAADRVKKRGEFRQIQGHGRKVHTKHFLVMVHAPLTEHPRARLGITITKKVGNAVARNRTRRVVREVFRRNPAIFPAGMDLVVIAKKGAPELGFDDVLGEFRRAQSALRRAAKQARGKSSADPARKGRSERQ